MAQGAIGLLKDRDRLEEMRDTARRSGPEAVLRNPGAAAVCEILRVGAEPGGLIGRRCWFDGALRGVHPAPAQNEAHAKLSPETVHQGRRSQCWCGTVVLKRAIHGRRASRARSRRLGHDGDALVRAIRATRPGRRWTAAWWAWPIPCAAAPCGRAATGFRASIPVRRARSRSPGRRRARRPRCCEQMRCAAARLRFPGCGRG